MSPWGGSKLQGLWGRTEGRPGLQTGETWAAVKPLGLLCRARRRGGLYKAGRPHPGPGPPQVPLGHTRGESHPLPGRFGLPNPSDHCFSCAGKDRGRILWQRGGNWEPGAAGDAGDRIKGEEAAARICLVVILTGAEVQHMVSGLDCGIQRTTLSPGSLLTPKPNDPDLGGLSGRRLDFLLSCN